MCTCVFLISLWIVICQLCRSLEKETFVFFVQLLEKNFFYQILSLFQKTPFILQRTHCGWKIWIVHHLELWQTLNWSVFSQNWGCVIFAKTWGELSSQSLEGGCLQTDHQTTQQIDKTGCSFSKAPFHFNQLKKTDLIGVSCSHTPWLGVQQPDMTDIRKNNCENYKCISTAISGSHVWERHLRWFLNPTLTTGYWQYTCILNSKTEKKQN